MRKLQRLAVVALTAVMALGSAGCVNSGSSSSSSKSTSSSTSNKHYKIGICQLVQHEALDAATKGFKAEVKKELGAKNVTFDEQNAQGDSSTASTICTNFASEKVDLILANASYGSHQVHSDLGDGRNQLPSCLEPEEVRWHRWRQRFRNFRLGTIGQAGKDDQGLRAKGQEGRDPLLLS